MADTGKGLGITGIHTIVFTPDPEGTRTFFRNVLELPHVDSGAGWLIFALPPAEVAAHPADEGGRHELSLMCDDIHSTIAELERRGVETRDGVNEERWGVWTTIVMPDGSGLQVYQPTHPSPIRP